MVVPLAAGSAVDNAMRVVTQRMAENMGQSIVIVGHSVRLRTGIAGRDGPAGIGLSSDSPYRSAADLIAATKASPGRLNYASGGNGSPQHVAMELFASLAGISLMHVPYKGATQAAVGVAAGEVPVAFQGLATVTGLIKGGKLRLIAVTTPQRLPQFPDVPTVSESGLPGFEFNSWATVMAPAGTAKANIARLNAEIVKALAAPDIQEKLLAQGLTPRGSSPEELRQATRQQLARYSTLMKQAGIGAE